MLDPGDRLRTTVVARVTTEDEWRQ